MYILVIVDCDLIYIIFNISSFSNLLALPGVCIFYTIVKSKAYNKIEAFIHKK